MVWYMRGEVRVLALQNYTNLRLERQEDVGLLVSNFLSILGFVLCVPILSSHGGQIR